MKRPPVSYSEGFRKICQRAKTLSADWPRMGEAWLCLVPELFVAGARRKRHRNQAAEETKVTTCAIRAVASVARLGARWPFIRGNQENAPDLIKESILRVGCLAFRNACTPQCHSFSAIVNGTTGRLVHLQLTKDVVGRK